MCTCACVYVCVRMCVCVCVWVIFMRSIRVDNCIPDSRHGNLNLLTGTHGTSIAIG